MDYYRSRKHVKGEDSGKSFYIWVIVIFVAVSFVGGIVLNQFLAESHEGAVALRVYKIKNVFLSTIMNRTPDFYYIDVEKNGKDFRLKKENRFEVSYRDEFVVKKVSTDILFEKGITVDIEGMGTANDMGVLLKGIVLVDKVVSLDGGDKKKSFNIFVKHEDKIIGTIPIDVKISPQDWLRYAKGSESKQSQIEYLKRAVEMKKDDIEVRKMLAKIYIESGKIDSGVSEYEKVLTKEPNDLVS